MQVYNFSGNTLTITTPPIILTEASYVNSVYAKSDGNSQKLLYMNLYLDGTNLTETMFLGYIEKGLLNPVGVTSWAYPANAKIEFVIKQQEHLLNNVDLSVVILGVSETGSGTTPGSSSSLVHHNGSLSIAASGSQTITLEESGNYFFLKSLLMDTINKNVTIDIEYKINGTYKLVKEDILNNLSEAYTYESNLVTDGVKINITNNDSSNSITVDWNAVDSVYN